MSNHNNSHHHPVAVVVHHHHHRRHLTQAVHQTLILTLSQVCKRRESCDYDLIVCVVEFHLWMGLKLNDFISFYNPL